MSTELDRHHQVVGVDGSPGSKHALAWAIGRAEQLGPVMPVSAWHFPWWAFVPTATGTTMPPGEDEFSEITARLVEQSLEGLDRRDLLSPVIVHGAAGPALVTAGSDASLIVVGTRGHGALTSGLLGSVSGHCTNQATVPVAVIPTEAPLADRYGVVVVGYDGSEHAAKAVEWAAENTPSATEIKVVHVWNPSMITTAQVEALAGEQLSAASQVIVNEAVEQFQSRSEFSDRVFTAISESGDARDVLRSEAAEADLLIVGARGRGSVALLPLGSVSSALIHRPKVATVIVH